jgi:hypothetical protein
VTGMKLRLFIRGAKIKIALNSTKKKKQRFDDTCCYENDFKNNKAL